MKQKLERVKNLIKSPDLVSYIDHLPEDKLDEIETRSNTIRLSLVMLVKNQEEIVTDVLNRLSKTDIDEFIVVDTGSTDGTLNILKSLSYVILHEIPWREDFAYMRNEAAKLATGDWIFIADSDELLLTENVDFKDLIALLEKVMTEEFSISFEQHIADSSAYGIPTRLYQPSSSQFFGLVHEELRSIADNHAIPNILTEIAVKNLGADDEQVAKFNNKERYAHLLAEMCRQEPENPRWFAMVDSTAIAKKIEEDIYENLLLKHLFKSGEMQLGLENIKQHPYIQTFLARYASFLIVSQRFDEAEKLVTYFLTINSDNVYLQFYKALIKIQAIKATTNQA
jgi:glycosyltransferase involved in cell wall biosynthesis